MYPTLSRVQSRGGAAYLLAVVGRIVCKDAGLCNTCVCPWTSSATRPHRRRCEAVMLLFSYLVLAVHGENGRKSGLQELRNRHMLTVPGEKGNRSWVVKICQRGFLQGMPPRSRALTVV